MRLRLGFHELQGATYRDGETWTLNAVQYLNVPTDDLQAQISSEIDRNVETEKLADVVLVTSVQPIYDDLADSLRRGCRLGFSGYSVLRDVIEAWTLCAMNFGAIQEEWAVPREAIDLRFDWISEQSPVLRGRFGIVELRVVENWVVDRSALMRAQAEVIRRSTDASYMYAPRTERAGHWLSSVDMEFNLRQLMTNAGYYPDLDSPDESLDHWCNSYLSSLDASQSLYAAPGCLPNFAFLQEEIMSTRGLIDFTLFPLPERFYQLMAGRSVVLVTPFAEEISAQFASRRVFDLYTDFTVPEFELTTVIAPLSIYPMRPHRSWTESFKVTCRLVEEAMESAGADLFIVAAGSYGMPLSHFALQRYGIETHYYGNYIHAFFGVEQSSTASFMEGRRKQESWIESPLKHLANVARVDDGRYV